MDKDFLPESDAMIGVDVPILETNDENLNKEKVEFVFVDDKLYIIIGDSFIRIHEENFFDTFAYLYPY